MVRLHGEHHGGSASRARTAAEQRAHQGRGGKPALRTSGQSIGWPIVLSIFSSARTQTRDAIGKNLTITNGGFTGSASTSCYQLSHCSKLPWLNCAG